MYNKHITFHKCQSNLTSCYNYLQIDFQSLPFLPSIGKYTWLTFIIIIMFIFREQHNTIITIKWTPLEGCQRSTWLTDWPPEQLMNAWKKQYDKGNNVQRHRKEQDYNGSLTPIPLALMGNPWNLCKTDNKFLGNPWLGLQTVISWYTKLLIAAKMHQALLPRLHRH